MRILLSKRNVLIATRTGALVCLVLVSCWKFLSSSDIVNALYTYTVVANILFWSFVPRPGTESEYRFSVARAGALFFLFTLFYFLMVRLGWFGFS